MKRATGKLIGALALAATIATTASPAEARRRGHHGGGDDAAIAIGAGIIGLGIGAAIASNGRRGGYYDGYYGHAPNYRGGYYGRGYYGGAYYGSGYYGGGYGGGYGGYYGGPRHYSGYYGRGYRGHGCRTRKVWDPYYGRRVKVRYC